MESNRLVISTSSNSSSSSRNNLNLVEINFLEKKDQKLKEKVVEEQEMENPREIQSLLGNGKKKMMMETNPHIGFNGEENERGSSSRSSGFYACSFCKKEFSTSQALGGHQNAHKQEREMEKKRKKMESDFPYYFSNYNNINPHNFINNGSSRFPFAGSFNYPQKINYLDPMIYKPPHSFHQFFNTNNIGYSSDHGGLALTTPCASSTLGGDNNRSLFRNTNNGPLKNLTLDDGFSKNIFLDGVSSKIQAFSDDCSKDLISTVGKSSATGDDNVEKEDQSEERNLEDWGSQLSLKI